MKYRKAVAAAVGAAAVGLAVWLARPTPITAIDQHQPRLNQAAPAPHGVMTVEQTLVAGHDGLSGVEMLAVVGPSQPAGAVLTVQVLDSAGQVLAGQDFAGLAHNAAVRLSFSPQQHSNGQTYRLHLSGTPDNLATVWAYSLDGYPAGSLLAEGETQAGDLHFSTTYTYLWSSLARDAGSSVRQIAVLAVPLWLLLFAPGVLVLDLVLPAGGLARVAGARSGLALGLSVSLLALGWLWASVLGWRWSPAGLWAVYGSLGGLAAALGLARWRRHGWRLPRFADIALPAVLLASIVVRMLAVRDLALPPWVDSSHHVLVARLLEAAGNIPASYRPLLPIDAFYYHFGFHTLAVSLHWMTALPLTDAVLLLGQLLNGLMPLAAYALAWGLIGRRRAALTAAVVVGLVSYFPGYFVNWGRYSQLAGLVVLGPAAAAFWRALKPAARTGGAAWRLGVLAAVLAAGVLLSHYRVLVFYLAFIGVAMLAHLRARKAWRVLLTAGAAGAALGLPWLVRLAGPALQRVTGSPSGLTAISSYNAIPFDYFRSSLERGWLALALLAGIWGLWRRDRGVWAGLAWIAVIFAGLNAGPATWLVNNNAWAISLFLPASVLVGWGADRWWHRARVLLAGSERAWRMAAGTLLAAGLLGLAAYGVTAGAATQVGILNPTTVLATRSDRQALEWLDRNLPPEAMVAVNGWNWLDGIWAGSDGGAWITPLTGRKTTLPPNDYVYGATPYKEGIKAFNAHLGQMTDANAPEFLGLLRGAGVTHIFIGARGGVLKPEMFVGSPNYTLLYSNGSAWIISIDAP